MPVDKGWKCSLMKIKTNKLQSSNENNLKRVWPKDELNKIYANILKQKEKNNKMNHGKLPGSAGAPTYDDSPSNRGNPLSFR